MTIQTNDEKVTQCSLPIFADPKARNAEIRVYKFLLTNLRDRTLNGDYHILVNYNILKNDGILRAIEIDVLLISHRGLFLIEVKNWGGQIEAFDGEWRVRGQPRRNPLISIQSKARVIKTHLFDPQIGLLRSEATNVEVVGLVVLANSNANYKDEMAARINPGNTTVDAEHITKGVYKIDGDLITALQSDRLISNDKRRLDDTLIRRIKSQLFSQHKLPESMVRNYQLLERLSVSGKLYESFIARDTELLDAPRLRIKRYLLVDYERQDKSLDQFRRSATAGAHITAHQNILSTKVFFQDDDRDDLYYEVTEWPNGKWLREAIDRYSDAVPFKDQLDILEAMCTALDHAHSTRDAAIDGGIIHRNLGPDTIFCVKRADNLEYKLADFDFARLAKEGTISASAQDNANAPTVIQISAVQSVFVAPEVENQPQAAKPQSDLFSLGALWFWLASRPEEIKMRPIPAQVDNLQAFPEIAAKLLKELLAPVPSQRPQDMRQVRETLIKLRSEMNNGESKTKTKKRADD